MGSGRDDTPLRSVTQPHVESFDQLLLESLPLAIAALPPQVLSVERPNGKPVVEAFLRALTVTVGTPTRGKGSSAFERASVVPRECRECSGTYAAPLTVTFAYESRGGTEVLARHMGLS